MKKIASLLLLIPIMILSSCGKKSEDSSVLSQEESSVSEVTSESVEDLNYTNPVWEPVLADPSIIRGDDGVFYAYGTQDNALWGTYYGVRYIPILSSTNLVDWEYADAAFKPATMPTWNTTSGAGLWAPDIVKIGDVYNLYYSFSAWGDPNPGIGVATSSSPLGPFVDQGKIFDSTEIGVVNSIDSAVYVDGDKVYMVWGSFSGIYGLELTADGLRLNYSSVSEAKNNKVLLAGVDNNRWQSGNYEGAYITKVGSWYYLYLSTGTCCEGFSSSYEVRVARSSNVLGPYYDAEGRLMTLTQNIGTSVVKGNDEFVGVGHNSIIKDDAGDEWIVYHGFDTQESPLYGNTNRRTLLIDKIIYTDQLWPHVANYGASRGSEKPYINS